MQPPQGHGQAAPELGALTSEPINPAELARQLKVPGLALRIILRAKPQLALSHVYWQRYELTPELVAAIKPDPDVQALIRHYQH